MLERKKVAFKRRFDAIFAQRKSGISTMKSWKYIITTGMKTRNSEIEQSIKATVVEKGGSLSIKDFSKPELAYLVKITPLSYDDGKMAYHHFVEGRNARDVMELVCWYSTNTFYRHKKIVLASLLEMARKIARQYRD